MLPSFRIQLVPDVQVAPPSRQIIILQERTKARRKRLSTSYRRRRYIDYSQPSVVAEPNRSVYSQTTVPASFTQSTIPASAIPSTDRGMDETEYGPQYWDNDAVLYGEEDYDPRRERRGFREPMIGPVVVPETPPRNFFNTQVYDMPEQGRIIPETPPRRPATKRLFEGSPTQFIFNKRK